MKRSEELELNALSAAASAMAAAARTAPKTRGIDNIEVAAVDDAETVGRLIGTMKEISKREARPSFERDAVSIGAAKRIVIVGVKSNPAGLNCGFCGYPTCAALGKTAGICAYNSVDLGIAAASAAAVAHNLFIDNRLMYSIGRAALDLKFFPDGVKQALGIPISITGKNPYFDRKQ
jgi:uncharacterized ferredoxin-like protein